MVTYGNKYCVTFVINYFAMKERLIQLLDLEQLSPSKFADLIGVQRSSISHVISGRNKPSFDFLQKTLKAFPGLNASWLMLGEGTMYEQMGRNVPSNLFDSAAPAETNPEAHISGADEIGTEIEASEEPPAAPKAAEDKEGPPPAVEQDSGIPEEAQKAPSSVERKRIVQVMIIYDDDTFRTFMPAQ
jgi:transcriptional regulator with XRE-family HTH domain